MPDEGKPRLILLRDCLRRLADRYCSPLARQQRLSTLSKGKSILTNAPACQKAPAETTAHSNRFYYTNSPICTISEVVSSATRANDVETSENHASLSTQL